VSDRNAILERALFPIKPGMAKEFAAAFAEARLLIEASPGFRRLEMRQGIETPDSFLLLVWWDSVEAHMQGFRESPAIHRWRALLSPFFAGTPRMEHFGQGL
jgi:heme-degrading monooxygenase HmoA